MTPGQIVQGSFLGNIAKGLEDRIAGLPIAGEVINGGRREAIEQLNRATVDEVLGPIGKKLPDDVATGQEAIAWAQEAVSNAYDEALEPMRAQADEALQDLSLIHI